MEEVDKGGLAVCIFCRGRVYNENPLGLHGPANLAGKGVGRGGGETVGRTQEYKIEGIIAEGAAGGNNKRRSRLLGDADRVRHADFAEGEDVLPSGRLGAQGLGGGGKEALGDEVMEDGGEVVDALAPLLAAPEAAEFGGASGAAGTGEGPAGVDGGVAEVSRGGEETEVGSGAGLSTDSDHVREPEEENQHAQHQRPDQDGASRSHFGRELHQRNNRDHNGK